MMHDQHDKNNDNNDDAIRLSSAMTTSTSATTTTSTISAWSLTMRDGERTMTQSRTGMLTVIAILCLVVLVLEQSNPMRHAQHHQQQQPTSTDFGSVSTHSTDNIGETTSDREEDFWSLRQNYTVLGERNSHTVSLLRADPPPLQTLIQQRSNNNNNKHITMPDGRVHSSSAGIAPVKRGIVGNVDWMLDFAIVGFAKCGTSHLKAWLNVSQSTIIIPGEVTGMAVNQPTSVVKRLYGAITTTVNQSHINDTTSKTKNYTIGIKFPGDIDSETSLGLYRTYFPSTKFIVQLRHPVLWFQSFYNFRYRWLFRVRNKMTQNKAPNATSIQDQTPVISNVFLHPNNLIGSCWISDPENDYRCLQENGCDTQKFSVCTNRAQFHHSLSRLGLTPLTDQHEWDLLDHHTMTIEPTSSSVFLLELTQMQGSSEMKETLRQDLQTFLGMEDLPPMPNYTVPYEHVPGEIDICQTQYSQVRKILVNHGRRASTWMERYLLKSPRIFVSSRKYFMEMLETWKKDPCIEP